MVISLVLSCFFSIFASAQPTEAFPIKDAFFVQKAQSQQIRIMSYNVQNLFDAEHDPDSFDYAFLPKNFPGKSDQCKTVTTKYYEEQCEEIDWTTKKVKQKIQQLVKVLTAHGTKPDILALQEIENENVIQMLAKAAGYSKYVLTDYKSHRGIDVAILYNSGVLAVIEEAFVKTPGRDPYRVQFRYLPTKETFYVYVNHWLAQSAPEEYRKTTAQALAADIEEVNKKNPGSKILALGDFNVTDGEEADIFGTTLLDAGWKNALVDVHSEAREQHPLLKKYFPNGSYYFSGKKVWRRFDRFFASQSFFKGKKATIDLKSYRVLFSEFLTGSYTYKVNDKDPKSEEVTMRYPLKYNFLDIPDRPLGFSDHLPISVLVQF